MSRIEKFFQRFFILFFSSISALILVVGIYRAKTASPINETSTPEPAPSQGNAEPATLSPSTSKNKVLSFLGKTVSSPYGLTSSAIKVQNGRIIAVTMPQVPNSPPSQYAKPYLIAQAIQAGSANIQGVSGATYTSNAFRQSLENAIAQASAQGQTVTAQPTPKITTPAPAFHGEDDF